MHLHVGSGLGAGHGATSATTARGDLCHDDTVPLVPPGQPAVAGRCGATPAAAAGGSGLDAGLIAACPDGSSRDTAINPDLDLWLLGGDDSRVNASCSYLVVHDRPGVGSMFEAFAAPRSHGSPHGGANLDGPGRHGATCVALASERHVRQRVGRAQGDLPLMSSPVSLGQAFSERSHVRGSGRGALGSGPMSSGQAFWEVLTGQSYSSSPTSLVVRAGMILPLGSSGASTQGQVLQHLRALLAAGVVLYVGITENPARRWAQHQEQNSMWDEMQILFIAESSRQTAALERAVLLHIRDRPDRPCLGCQNVGPGGECASAGSPHYLYAVVSRSGLWRRGRR